MRIALMAAAVALSAARGDSRPALVKKGTGPSGVLNPLDEWHSVPLGGGMGLLHADDDRARRAADPSHHPVAPSAIRRED